MESSFTPIENMINSLADRHREYPFHAIVLTRLSMHIYNKLLETRNSMLKSRGINETLFNALITVYARKDQCIQPSELSLALGSSRTNATRIADELEKRGWIARKESNNDRRCLYLHLTEGGLEFLAEILPPQHQNLHALWEVFTDDELQQLETLQRKFLTHLDKIEVSKIKN